MGIRIRVLGTFKNGRTRVVELQSGTDGIIPENLVQHYNKMFRQEIESAFDKFAEYRITVSYKPKGSDRFMYQNSIRILNTPATRVTLNRVVNTVDNEVLQVYQLLQGGK